MDTSELLPGLAMFTLIGVVVAALIGILLFKRKKANQHPMEKSPDGAIAMVEVSADNPPPPTIRATDE